MFYSGKEKRGLAAAKPWQPTAAKAPCPPTPFDNWCKLRALLSDGESGVWWAAFAAARRMGPRSATRPVDAQRTGVCQRVGKFIGPGS
jgi:hypothetical protein